ncbi:MAG: Flp family type IVb pilin [Methylobacteriaceae bacterium]|jgi:pilus assembly protein Flp/PilA|nr:Flp family type IVb pilin [Methylobacteriaceae bacterium]MDR1828713.1 Flp family type IVb pilin [Methylobacteriaceae bacterium]
MIKSFLRNESGATAIEYGLIAALISVAAVVAMRYVGTELSSTFHYVGSNMSSARAT